MTTTYDAIALRIMLEEPAGPEREERLAALAREASDALDGITHRCVECGRAEGEEHEAGCFLGDE